MATYEEVLNTLFNEVRQPKSIEDIEISLQVDDIDIYIIHVNIIFK